MLVELRTGFEKQVGGLGLVSSNRVKMHRDSVLSMDPKQCQQLVSAILRQESVPVERFAPFFRKGLVFLERNAMDVSQCKVAAPYPWFLNFLEALDRPDCFADLFLTSPTGANPTWSSKAFEAVVAMRVAIDMKDFPYDVPCDPLEVVLRMKPPLGTPCSWRRRKA